jgi:hypothetical protein
LAIKCLMFLALQTGCKTYTLFNSKGEDVAYIPHPLVGSRAVTAGHSCTKGVRGTQEPPLQGEVLQLIEIILR